MTGTRLQAIGLWTNVCNKVWWRIDRKMVSQQATTDYV